MLSIRRVLAVLLSCLLIGGSASASAQSWPTKPVHLIAVFPPGGSVDQVARLIGHQITVQTGQQVIVENRGGASGSVGTAAVAKADPDGYTRGPLMNDAIGNQVPLAIGSVFLVSPHIASGKLRAIAVTSARPDPKLPGVEPIAAQGVPGFEAYTWWAIFAPANMRPELARRISEEFAKAVKTPEVAEKLSAQGIEVRGGLPAELDSFVRKEIPRWAKVIKDNNIKSGD